MDWNMQKNFKSQLILSSILNLIAISICPTPYEAGIINCLALEFIYACYG